MKLSCRICKRVLDAEAFSVDRHRKSGRTTECKECRRVMNKTHYEANREHYKEVRAAWWERSKDALKESRSEYRENNKDRLRELQRAWLERNRDRRNEYGREYLREDRKRDPEKYRVYSRTRRANNPDAVKLEFHRQRAGGDITVAEWQWLLKQCGHKCVRCGVHQSEAKSIYPGRADRLELDHIVPVSQGGHSTLLNIQPLCSACNNFKRYKILDFRPAKVLRAVLNKLNIL